MEFELLTPAELAVRRRRWFTTQGDHPRKDQDPTDEQLSCLAGTVAAHLVPYADWGVFGPNGIRHEREVKFKKWIANPDGGGRYIEIRGADCSKSWTGAIHTNNDAVYAIQTSILTCISRNLHQK